MWFSSYASRLTGRQTNILITILHTPSEGDVMTKQSSKNQKNKNKVFIHISIIKSHILLKDYSCILFMLANSVHILCYN